MNNKLIPIQYVKGVGEKRAALLKKLGIETVLDAVNYYPRDYIDLSSPVPINKIVPDTVCCFKAYVGYDVETNEIRRGMTIYKTLLTDGTNGVRLSIFNNGYIAKSLQEGKEYLFYGKVTANMGGLEISNPLVESVENEFPLKAVYPLTAGLTSNTLTKIIANALDYCRKNSLIKETLPSKIREEFSLCLKDFALQSIHFPQSNEDLDKAKKRLVFDEFLTLQLAMMKLKSNSRSKASCRILKDCSEEFMTLLPFEMTGAQKRAVKECITDLAGLTPMNRLIQGDVGSGKTAVAAACIYTCCKNGFQCAFMAPTDILARQHAESLTKLFKGTDIKIDLLTGSRTPKQKREIKEKLLSGEIQVIVGTHALITSDVEFSKLALVITDEQHRFGVTQRKTLSQKGEGVHTLVMSATPIPRTISLIIYGDLDLTVIDELPKGRQKISTYAVDTSYRARICAFIKKHLDMGLRAYIVCPLVEESESDLVSAVEYMKKLQEDTFSNYSVGLLHGKMKPKEKERIMADFVSGKLQLLVSTVVIEVGIDVPESVIMVIENAERYGLSQLHQLRGRVGRGSEKSYCILISDAKNDTARERLDIMCKTRDGFKIADKDLEIRGPGDFFGSRQHGLPKLKIADLSSDMDTLRQSRQAANEIIKNDPQLKSNPALAKEVEEMINRV
ncbi:MAG: ATP-dependent DNA helicase RecG [Acutalibacteraceae bacterium]